MRRWFVPLVLGIILAAPLFQLSTAQGPVGVFITAPDVGGTGRTITVNVTVAGGPGDEGGNFMIKAYLTGANLEGASPTEGLPSERTSSENSFTLNVTLPLEEQQVELVVEANSTNGVQWTLGSSSKQISVLVPLTVSALVTNTGTVTVENVPVYLYLDGQRVNNSSVSILAPGESKSVFFDYLPAGLSVGTHTLEIVVDFNADGVIDPAAGEVVRSLTFVKEADPINPIWIFIGVVVAIVAGLFIAGYIRQRRKGS